MDFAGDKGVQTMPPSLWFTANWIWVLTIAATVGLLAVLMTWRRGGRGKR